VRCITQERSVWLANGTTTDRGIWWWMLVVALLYAGLIAVIFEYLANSR
jgi:fatty acid desaturase